MKYDFDMGKMSPNSAQKKVLRRIRPGSTVLECGCATGYMTMYMGYQDCKVSIIEKDRVGFIAARPYAVDGYCGDLSELYTWSYFGEKKFDYVLFADVLEHMTDPMFAIKHAKEMLKDDGQIIISIPNICHNDIIMMMTTDNFNYTRYGLLDDTHVHFWGLHDFLKFCDDAGLEITETDTVRVNTGSTEHGWAMNIVEPELQKALSRRTSGEIYQYIFVCRRKKNG